MDEFDIPLFKKLYGFYKEFYIALREFPRHDRYSLGQQCETLVLEILGCIMRASRLSKQDKVSFLEDASFKLNFLRVHIRLAKDVKALSNKQYVFFQTLLDEIGRMIGGWLRSVKANS